MGNNKREPGDPCDQAPLTRAVHHGSTLTKNMSKQGMSVLKPSSSVYILFNKLFTLSAQMFCHLFQSCFQTPCWCRLSQCYVQAILSKYQISMMFAHQSSQVNLGRECYSIYVWCIFASCVCVLICFVLVFALGNCSNICRLLGCWITFQAHMWG